MCRLFGFRSNTPEAVHRSLLTEKNSLRVQSAEHRDGWGIAYYRDGPIPQVAHGIGPAHSDPEFERVSSLLSSRAVLAHVRLASVGDVHLRNAHPFQWGRWSFAHNGTISNYYKHQDELENAIDPRFRPLLKSETDSERCFYLFLSHLGSSGSVDSASVESVARALAQTIHLISRIADEPKGTPSSMNLLVTNGEQMVGTRRHRTLFLSARPHISDSAALNGARPEQVVIASEKLCGEPHWSEIPDGSVVSVDEEMVFRQWTISSLL